MANPDRRPFYGKNVLCVIMGGGRGKRLFPLTKERAKPAVPVAVALVVVTALAVHIALIARLRVQPEPVVKVALKAVVSPFRVGRAV